MRRAQRSAVRLTLQSHGAVFRKFVWVEEDRGRSIQGVLHIKHILVLEAFVVRVEIPANKKGNKVHAGVFATAVPNSCFVC